MWPNLVKYVSYQVFNGEQKGRFWGLELRTRSFASPEQYPGNCRKGRFVVIWLWLDAQGTKCIGFKKGKKKD